MYDIQGRMNRAPSRSILCDGIKGEKQRGGLTEWESRVSANQKMARLYLHTYIHTHTYIHIGTISARVGEVEKTVTACTYLISTLALHIALPHATD
jgi:hypothetical protein